MVKWDTNLYIKRGRIQGALKKSNEKQMSIAGALKKSGLQKSGVIKEYFFN